jgi:hypothetical protein
MNRRLCLLCLFAGLITLLPALAQAQWSARLSYPPSLSLKLENLWSVTVTNQATGPTDVTLRAELNEQNRGLVFRGTTNVLSIPPGGKRVTKNDVTNLSDTYYEPGLEKKLKKTQIFPPGRYSFCVQVLEAQSGRMLAMDCVQNYQVTNPNPPRAISPKDSGVVIGGFPVFQWTSPTPLPEGAQVSYDFKLCEILPSQGRYDAIHNIPFYEQKGLARTSLPYPLSAKALEPGKAYCWQVAAKDALGEPFGENSGKSEVRLFVFSGKGVKK